MCLSQKWKSLAASLEDEIRQVKQQRDHLQLQLEEKRAAISSSSQPDDVHQPGPGQAEDSHVSRHQDTARACAELCKQQEMDLISSMPSNAEWCADALNRNFARACAARLRPLAAESEQMLSTGMTQEACRFLMEVRSMQLATQVCLPNTSNCITLHDLPPLQDRSSVPCCRSHIANPTRTKITPGIHSLDPAFLHTCPCWQVGGHMASLAAVPEAQDCAAQQRANDDDGAPSQTVLILASFRQAEGCTLQCNYLESSSRKELNHWGADIPRQTTHSTCYVCAGANVRRMERMVSETSPLQAVVWFIRGPMLAIPPCALQNAYATDALAYIQQHLEGAGPKDRDSLHALAAGKSGFPAPLPFPVIFAYD